MIAGVKKADLTIDAVMKKITEYDIFRFYMGHRKWEINKVTNSPFHVDDHPSFIVGNRYGFLYFIDFADSQYRGDCFDFVMQLFTINLNEALLMIDRDFGLGIVSTNNVGEYNRIRAAYKQPEEDVAKVYSVIQVVTRKYTHEELSYWNDYHQDIQDLRDNHIHSISKVFLNKKRFPMKDTDLRFGYLYGNKWKIYRPFADKKSKWVPNNVPISTMEGVDCLNREQPAFINKSKKDMMVMKKVYPYSCAVQNESVACFSEENVRLLKDNSSRQILSFDADVPGVTNSLQITQLYNFDYCNVPREYLKHGIKDWALLAKEYGLQAIEKHLKEKNIL